MNVVDDELERAQVWRGHDLADASGLHQPESQATQLALCGDD
jgi:hypothetical protein